MFPIAGQPGVSGTQRVAGAWSRLVEVNTEQDGITKKVRNSYDMASGLLRTSMTYFTNSDGTPRVITEEIRPAWAVDIYQSAFIAVNFLQAEAQRVTWTASAAELETVTSGYGTIAAATATVWSNAWSPPSPDFPWAVSASYRLATETTNAVFPFSSPPTDGSWLLESHVNQRSWPGGIIVEQVNGQGMAASNLYDRDGIWLVARFENASIAAAEAGYASFEPTERDAGWRVEPGGGPVPVTDADSNTGTTSMVVPAQRSGATGPALTLTPADQTRRYVLSCFVKVPEQFAGEPGRAVWQVSAANGPTPVGTAVELAAIPDHATAWTYLFGIFDLPTFRTANNIPVATQLALTFKLVNGKRSAAVGVDNLRIAPLDCVAEAQAVDPQTLKVTAIIGTNGELWRHLYDEFGQPVGINGPDVGPSSIEQDWFSREAGRFNPAEPNRKLQIAARNSGRYDRFRTADWQQDWSGTAPAAWTADDGALTYSGNSAGTISFTAAGSTANRAVRVQIDGGQTAPSAPVFVAVAGVATLAWNPRRSPAGFELADGSGAVLASSDAVWPGSQIWVLIVQDGAAAGFVDGRLVAAAPLASAAAGEAVLGAGSSGVRFREAMVIEAPIVTTEFSDAAKRAIQRQLMVGRQAQVSQMLYDKLEHQIIETKSALADPDSSHPLLTYRGDFAVLDPASMKLTGLVNTAWPDDGGYPYRRRTYYADPLARVEEVGAPGAAFSIIPGAPTGHTAKLRYGPNDGRLGLAAGTFAANWTRGQDNVTHSSVMNELAAELAVGTETAPGSGVYSYSHTEIDGLGRPTKVKPPNYFTPPAGSNPDDWVSTTAYDMLGRIIEINEPRGRGKTTYIYDAAGRVRFLQSGQDAADGRIAYFRYDLLGRLVEQGSMTAAWNRAALQAQAYDPAQPSGSSAVWRRRLFYDGDGAHPYAIGRVCLAYTRDQATGAEVIESYTWDIFGNLATETTQAAAFDEETRVIASVRDRLNNPVTVTINAGDTVLATLTYAYDPLGRLAAIGDGTMADAFARYAYNAESQIVTEAFGGLSSGLAVQYGYAPPGWPASINATARGTPRFSETLSFTSGGTGTPDGYFSSLIAKTEFSVDGSSFSTRFAYDAQARVTVADDSRDSHWTVGEPQAVTYDSDSNLVTLTQGSQSQDYTYMPGSDRLRAIRAGMETLASVVFDLSGQVTSLIRGTDTVRPQYSPATGETVAILTGAQGSDGIIFGAGNDGRRITRTVTGTPSAATLSLYGSGRQPLAMWKKDTQGRPVLRLHVWGPHGLVAYRDSGRTRYVVRDHLLSTRAVLDETGAIVGRVDYDPWGAPYPDTSLNDLPEFLYTGYLWDPEIRLYDAVSRFYDPVTRRFLSPDPAAEFFSCYIFSGNNPIRFRDPEGRQIGLIIFIVSLVVSAVVAGVAAGIAGWKAGHRGAQLAGDIFAGIGIALTASVAGAFVGAAAGAAAGAAGGAVAAAAGATAATVESVTTVTAGIVGGAVGGTVGGLTSSLLTGAQSHLSGDDLNRAVWEGALVGFVSGTIMGAFGGVAGLKAFSVGDAVKQLDFGAAAARLGGQIGLDTAGLLFGTVAGAAILEGLHDKDAKQALQDIADKLAFKAATGIPQKAIKRTLTAVESGAKGFAGISRRQVSRSLPDYLWRHLGQEATVPDRPQPDRSAGGAARRDNPRLAEGSVVTGPELPAELADAALPLLLYAESCPRCRFLARLVRLASLGAIRLEPMEREVWRRFYHEKHPETRGHPVLFRGMAGRYGDHRSSLPFRRWSSGAGRHAPGHADRHCEHRTGSRDAGGHHALRDARRRERTIMAGPAASPGAATATPRRAALAAGRPLSRRARRRDRPARHRPALAL